MSTAFHQPTVEQYRELVYEPARRQKIAHCSGHPYTRCCHRDCPHCGERKVRRDQALTFQAHERIRQQYPRCNVQFLTGTVQDCYYEHMRVNLRALKAGLSQLLRQQNTLGWVAAVEVVPSRLLEPHEISHLPPAEQHASSALFIHPHIHALVWTAQYSPLCEEADWNVQWQAITKLGASLQVSARLSSSQVKKQIYYLHKLGPFEKLQQAPELFDKVRFRLVSARLVERGGMAKQVRKRSKQDRLTGKQVAA